MQGPPRRHRSPALRLAHVVRAVHREALQVAARLRRGRRLARRKVMGWKRCTERALGDPCNATSSPHAAVAPQCRTCLCHRHWLLHRGIPAVPGAAPAPTPSKLLCTILHRARRPPQILSFTCTCSKPAIRLNTGDGYVTDGVCPTLQHNWDPSLLVDPLLFEINTETSPRRKPVPNPPCPLGRSHH